MLQTRIELFKAKALALEEAIEAGTFAREMLFNLRLHRLRVRARKHCLVGEIERVHRIEPLELQIIVRAAASFDKQLIEQKLHHQEGRPQIEAILAKAEFGIAAADDILLFEDLNPEAALRKKHRGGESARSGSHDCDVSFSIACIKAHTPTIGTTGEVTAGIELSKWNHLLHRQRSRLSLPICKHVPFR